MTDRIRVVIPDTHGAHIDWRAASAAVVVADIQETRIEAKVV